MSMKNYFRFVKWYFDYIGKECFGSVRAWRNIIKKDRLPTVIMAYILMILSLLLLFTAPFNKYIFYGCMLMLSSIMFLYSNKFTLKLTTLFDRI